MIWLLIAAASVAAIGCCIPVGLAFAQRAGMPRPVLTFFSLMLSFAVIIGFLAMLLR